MPKPSSNAHWKKFRAEVIELDGNRCRRCTRGPADGVVLQVHHLIYLPGRLPWDYPYQDCETLCKGCHAESHGLKRPSIGWDYMYDEDLGDLSGTCEVCGTELRYLFWIQHPHWEPIGVGTYCCDHLTGTQLASNHMESVQRFRSRQTRFISSSRWTSERGVFAIRQKQIDLEIVPHASKFLIRMNGTNGFKRFDSADDAKKAAFEVIDNGKADEYLKKRPR